jgi:protein SCO1
MTRANRIERIVLAGMLAAATLVGVMRTAPAHDTHHHAAQPAAKPKAARVILHEIGLVDTDGQTVRFKSEAVGSQIVIMDFIYTSCTTICPVTSAMFAEVQERLMDKLGEGFGRDVKLISLTVDPVRDTPERLGDYARHFGTPEGWLWLTGNKPQMDKVLAGLGAYAADFTRHSGAVLVGDARSGEWTRFSGLPDPADIVERVERLLAARKQASLSERK